MLSLLKLVFIGAVNIDIFADGLVALPEAGRQENGTAITISAGGKSCNMARMSAALLEKGSVAMVAKIVKDKDGLWKKPFQELESAGINIKPIIMMESVEGDLPTIALILGVEGEARRVLYFPGRNESLSMDDIDRAQGYLEQLAENQGLLVMSCEMPAETLFYILDKASMLGLKVMVDPGGAHHMKKYAGMLNKQIFLLKPNADEAEQLSGIEVKDFESAGRAAKRLMTGGIRNVLITHGENGAYLFDSQGGEHICAETLEPVIETTGSGDQVMAVVAAGLLKGVSLREAASLGVRAGTRQCMQAGTKPLEWVDI